MHVTLLHGSLHQWQRRGCGALAHRQAHGEFVVPSDACAAPQQWWRPRGRTLCDACCNSGGADKSCSAGTRGDQTPSVCCLQPRLRHGPALAKAGSRLSGTPPRPSSFTALQVPCRTPTPTCDPYTVAFGRVVACGHVNCVSKAEKVNVASGSHCRYVNSRVVLC